MVLEAHSGYASATGTRDSNEDYCGIVIPESRTLSTKGVMAVLADGVGGSGGGREAAEFSVRGLLSDYYATPDTWAIPHAIEKVLQPINRWLLAQSFSQNDNRRLVSTLSALVLYVQRRRKRVATAPADVDKALPRRRWSVARRKVPHQRRRRRHCHQRKRQSGCRAPRFRDDDLEARGKNAGAAR